MFSFPAFEKGLPEICESSLAPEFRLMLAIVEDALVIFQSGLRSANPVRRVRSCEAERWFRSTENDHVFSFESICAALELDAGYIRAGIFEMKHAVNMKKEKPRRIRLRRANAEGEYGPYDRITIDAKESRRSAR